MGIKISEMTPDANITGVELIPVSDAGVAKSISVGGIRDFTIAEIELVAAASGVSASDAVFILTGGELKPVDISHVAQHAINIVWAKTAESAPGGSAVVPLKESGTEKTLTLANLATYVRDAVKTAILDVSGLDAATSPNVADNLLLTQGATGKKLSLGDLNTAIFAGLKTYVTGLDEVTTPGDDDEIFIIQGSQPYKASLSQILNAAGTPVTGPGDATADTLAAWAGGNVLKEGVAISTSLAAASDSVVPTALAVKNTTDLLAPLAHVGAGGAAHLAASTSTAGFMSAADKTKLDGVQSGAQVNPDEATPEASGLMSAADKAKLNFVDVSFKQLQANSLYGGLKKKTSPSPTPSGDGGMAANRLTAKLLYGGI